MTELAKFTAFLKASTLLCGFDQFDLNATDCSQEFFDTLSRQVGSDNLAHFLDKFASEQEPTAQELESILKDERTAPIARNLICMWYLGNWNGLPDTWLEKYGKKILAENKAFVISAGAYKEGLAWKAMGAHPMGAKPGGFGSWALAPNSEGSDGK